MIIVAICHIKMTIDLIILVGCPFCSYIFVGSEFGKSGVFLCENIQSWLL